MVPFAGLLAALEQIPDPRRRQGQRYSLAPLLLFAVLAVLAGATSYRRIRLFIGVHRERLNAAFGAGFRRAPAINTLRTLFHALDPAELEAAFRDHAEQLGNATAAPGRRVVALDGKTLRGSFDHLDDRAAAQVLSAFAGEAALILAHQEIAGGDVGEPPWRRNFPTYDGRSPLGAGGFRLCFHRPSLLLLCHTGMLTL